MDFKKTPATVLAVALLSVNPAAADSTYKLGVLAYRKGDYAKASIYLEDALKTRGNDPNLWYYDALCFHQLKNWPMATQRYKTIVTSFGHSEAAQKARVALQTLAPNFIQTLDAQRHTATTGSAASSSATRETPASAAGPSDAELASLPDAAYFYFTKTANGHMEVDVQVNGHPIKALFDTGASAFFYKDQLKAAGVDVNGATAGRSARGWAGVSVPTTTMTAEIKLGTLTRRVPIVMEESTNSVGQNLVGQTLVRGYQYEIDDKGSRVDLKKTLSTQEKKSDPLYDIPVTVVHQKDFVPIQLNGRQVSAFIDTGAARTVVDPETAKRAGLEETGEMVHMSGVGGSVTMAVAYATIRIGPMVRDNCQVLIGGQGGTAIGQDVMEGWRCKVDREHNLLRFFH